MYHIFPDMSMLGENSESLGFYVFWADVLCSIASFTMILITAKSVDLNNKQLKELKRQWQEDHTPNLSCELSCCNKTDYLRLRILNTSHVIADNIRINIFDFLDYSDNSEVDANHINDLKSFLNTQSFILPPQRSIYFNLYIPINEMITPINGFIEVHIESPAIASRQFKLYPSNFKYYSEF